MRFRIVAPARSWRHPPETRNATFLKVTWNGVVVHEGVEVRGPTRAALLGDESPTGPLMLQGDHGPVAYRNLRLRPVAGLS